MTATTWSDRIIELRQYTVHTELRHQLVDVFDEQFVEGQERDGMHIVGQFVDLDRSDRFVWLRGFDNMEQRHDALTAFYTGPIWRAHQHRANPTMVDIDDVLLLQPAGLWDLPPADYARDPRIVEIALCPLESPMTGHDIHRLVDAVRAYVDAPIAVLTTLHAVNTFPSLPVRDGDEHVVVIYARKPSPDPTATPWTHVVEAIQSVQPALRSPITRRRLLPTTRSALR